MPSDREVAMDQIERRIAEDAAKACNEKFGEYFTFRLDGRKYVDGRYVISRESKRGLHGIDHATTGVAIQYFIDGYRLAAIKHGEW